LIFNASDAEQLAHRYRRLVKRDYTDMMSVMFSTDFRDPDDGGYIVGGMRILDNAILSSNNREKNLQRI